jgi:hypothetical protein
MGETGRVALAVVFVSYNTKRLTALLLWSLYRVLEPRAASVIVVDNASTDGSADLLRQVRDAGLCTLIASSVNVGHGAALNLALNTEAVRGASRAWILDSDCVIARSDAFSAALDMHPAAALIGEGQWDPWHERRRLEAYSLVVDPIALGRPDIAAFVDGGDPAYELLVSAERAGLAVADFPFTAEGFIIHLGRGSLAAVAGARDESHPLYAWAVGHNEPHFGGVNGARDHYALLVERFTEEVGEEPDLVSALRGPRR